MSATAQTPFEMFKQIVAKKAAEEDAQEKQAIKMAETLGSHAVELLMLDKLYDAIDEHLEEFKDDEDEMNHLKSAADDYLLWWDNQREEGDEDARDDAISDFLGAIRGILPTNALRYYENHADWEAVLGNLATTISDYEADEESDDE